jgi:hypothetical protein
MDVVNNIIVTITMAIIIIIIPITITILIITFVNITIIVIIIIIIIIIIMFILLHFHHTTIGLSEFRVQTSEDILRILAVGTNNRMTRSTDFNTTSSRSHALLQLTFEIETQTEMGQTIINR